VIDNRPMQAPRQMSAVRWSLALVAPIGVLALGYGLWAISDRLVYIGPLDKAQFGWLVVVPIAAVAPVTAAFAWQRLPQTAIAVAATLFAVTFSVPAAAAFWVSVAHPDCQFGSVMTGADAIRAAVIVGAVAGGGYALAGLLATVEVRRGHPWRGALLGAMLGFAMLWIAVFTAFAMAPVGLCQRPPS
jgi:hypothetical protein